MLKTMLLFGVAAGVIVAAPMFLLLAVAPGDPVVSSQYLGYSLILLALSLIFVGVKRFRDTARGGVIKFAPALLMGLGISAVAGVIYVIGWEITLHLTNFRFTDDYARMLLDNARAKGADAAKLARVQAEADAFKAQYANPFFRLPMTFVEIFPVGVLVSLVSAALLRNSRFMPARTVAR